MSLEYSSTFGSSEIILPLEYSLCAQIAKRFCDYIIFQNSVSVTQIAFTVAFFEFALLEKSRVLPCRSTPFFIVNPQALLTDLDS